VGRITKKSRSDNGKILTGYISYGKDGRPFDVPERLEEGMEEMVRFVAFTLDYQLSEVYAMNILEFFRDVNRAKELQRKRKDQMKKKK